MKANQASQRNLRDDDIAVSAVIGAVLVLAVLTVALVQWRLEWVPVLEGENEAGVALLVDSQMGAVRAHLNEIAANATQDAAALPVKLGAQEGKAFGDSVSLPNGLEMQPNTGLWNVTAPSLLIYEKNGRSLSAVGNNWTPIPSSVAINDISSIRDLRWRIADVDSAHDTRAARATILDSRALFAGSYEVLVDVETPHLLVRHTIRNADNEIITSRADAYAESSAFTPYFVSLLDPQMAFDQVVATASGPFTLVMAQDPGFDTDYMASYSLSSTAGRIPVSTSGVLYTDYEATVGSGALAYISRNSFYPSQEVRIEGGGIIVRQDDGAAFRSEPLVRVVMVGDQMLFEITAPKLIGDESSVNGDVVANVVGIPLDQDSITGSATQIAFTLQTSSPTIWASLFHQRLQAGGLTDQGTNPGYLVNATADSVQVQVFGPRPDPASNAHDVVLCYRTATILVEVDT